MRSSGWPRIIAEQLVVPDEPLALLVRPGGAATPAAVAARAAGALLDLPEREDDAAPPWLAPHQVPAARRLAAIIARHGGALLADATGLGKSYVALAVAQGLGGPLTLVVPAVLVAQWRALLARLETRALIVTHETLSRPQQPPARPPNRLAALVVVDEAHRFRNPDTNRYRALARLVIGTRVLLVTATPVHNRLAELFHLFRLFLRDHALTGLGVPSLVRAARGEAPPDAVAAVAARLTVARSRGRVGTAYAGGAVPLSFPEREGGLTIRAGTAPAEVLASLVAGIQTLGAGTAATSLFRLTLLRRLASSLPAFVASLDRYATFLRFARDAAATGRTLRPADFERLVPRTDDGDVQLALLPLLLDSGATARMPEDLALVRRLRALAACDGDPKAEALDRLLRDAARARRKVIVFTDAVPTVRHLARRLGRRLRVATITGGHGSLGRDRARQAEVLRAFAPLAQGAPPPARALVTDVLIATDLVSEGLNLQDAARVIHYDLPWSPARLAQRVGRVDRLGSPHARVDGVTFLPPAPLARALEIEERLATKVQAQVAAGAAERETVRGRDGGVATLDWCDRLQALGSGAAAEVGACVTVEADECATVLVVRIGGLVEALVVRGEVARPDPREATRLLERSVAAPASAPDPALLNEAIRRAAPLVRARLAAVAEARWRAADRDRLSRRLIPWVLTAARRAARLGNAAELRALDALVSRLSLGMTAGEERSLGELLERAEPLTIEALRRWHEGLPPAEEADGAAVAELVAAVVLRREHG